MPTPDLIAAPNSTTATHGPALPAPATAVPEASLGPQAFAAMLTALLPPTNPGLAVPTPNAGATSARTRTTASAAETVRGGKSKPGRKDESAAAVSMPPLLPLPPPPTPPPHIVAIAPRTGPADAPHVDATSIGPIDAAPIGNDPAAKSTVAKPPTGPSSFSASPVDRTTVPIEPLAREKAIAVTPATIDLAGAQVSPHVPGPVAAVPEKPPLAPTGSSPAEQLAPVLVSVAKDAAGGGHIALHLRPPALGDLQITIERTPNAPTQVRIAAERPETLALLQRDTPHLQRALDQAGVARDSMTVTFHAAPTVTAVSAAQDAGQMSRQFLGTGQPHQGFADGRPRHAPTPNGDANGPDTPIATDPANPRRSIRSGIDITA